MDELLAKLQTPLGPLQAWEWGALAGGGLLVFRLLRQGHQTTGVQTVTLTPNNQPDLPSSAGQDTTGSIISALNTLPFAPGEFSYTLPNGTTLSWTNSGLSVSNPTSAGSTPSNPPATTPGGSSTATAPSTGISNLIGPVLAPLPIPRTSEPVRPSNPDTMPAPRAGGAIVGANPRPYPGYTPPIYTGVTANPIRR